MVLQGDYESFRRFIYELETLAEFVIIDDVTLAQGEPGKPLTLTLELSTYYRVGAQWQPERRKQIAARRRSWSCWRSLGCYRAWPRRSPARGCRRLTDRAATGRAGAPAAARRRDGARRASRTRSTRSGRSPAKAARNLFRFKPKPPPPPPPPPRVAAPPPVVAARADRPAAGRRRCRRSR